MPFVCGIIEGRKKGIAMLKNLIIAFLFVMVLALAAECVWLHITCERQREDIAGLALTSRRP